MAQFHRFLLVALPALAAGFSLDVKPKEPPQDSQGVSPVVFHTVRSDVSCFPADDCGDSPEDDPDSTSNRFDAVSGRRLHNDASTANCNDRHDCCPSYGGTSNTGGSWSGATEGPGTYANKRVHCDSGCDRSCDDGHWACNGDCESRPPSPRVRRLHHPDTHLRAAQATPATRAATFASAATPATRIATPTATPRAT